MVPHFAALNAGYRLSAVVRAKSGDPLLNGPRAWSQGPVFRGRRGGLDFSAPECQESAMNNNKRYQVAIVGAGPVGMALAIDLGLRGISCILIERRTEPQRIPKGQNLTQRSVEHFYFWGIADELRAARVLPPDYPMNGIIAYESLASDYWYAPPLREIVNAYYFQNNERLPQYQTEMVMRKRIAGLPGIESRFGWSAEAIAQDASGVSVAITEQGGSGRETIMADYVVGCDGGHSTVRQQIGIERAGADFDQLMVLA